MISLDSDARKWHELTYSCCVGSTLGLIAFQINVDIPTPGVDFKSLGGHKKVYEAVRLLEEACTEAVLDALPEFAARAEREKTELLGAFGKFGAMYKQTPNTYWRPGDPWGKFSPWYEVATPIGPITVGWRKRVIQLSWEQSYLPASADELFPTEDVTKNGKTIHAQGPAKLQEYIQTLMKAANAQLLPMAGNTADQQTTRIG